MSKAQFWLFVVQMIFEFGLKLWPYLLKLIRAIQEQDKRGAPLSTQSQIAMFRVPAKRKWMEVRGAVPSDAQLRRAYVCAKQRVNGRKWMPAPEEIKVAGLGKYYA